MLLEGRERKEREEEMERGGEEENGCGDVCVCVRKEDMEELGVCLGEGDGLSMHRCWCVCVCGDSLMGASWNHFSFFFFSFSLSFILLSAVKLLMR